MAIQEEHFFNRLKADKPADVAVAQEILNWAKGRSETKPQLSTKTTGAYINYFLTDPNFFTLVSNGYFYVSFLALRKTKAFASLEKQSILRKRLLTMPGAEEKYKGETVRVPFSTLRDPVQKEEFIKLITEVLQDFAQP